jgi:hypothetical protein
VGSDDARPVGHDDVDLQSNEFTRDNLERIAAIVREAVFDLDRIAFDIAEAMKFIAKGVP